MSEHHPAAVIVLAAGAGTRMKSAIPKVLHQLAGRSLVHHAIAAARATGGQHIAVVVRHERAAVVAHLGEVAPDVLIADQDDVMGTGRAAECGLAAIDATVNNETGLVGTVVVTYGDVPLLSASTINRLVKVHEKESNGVTVLTAFPADTTGLGRILRDENHEMVGIMEHKDALAEKAQNGPWAHALEILETNSGIYAFDASLLRSALQKVSSENVQGEKYLTDVIGIAREAGHRVAGVCFGELIETEGVNDKAQLARLARAHNKQLVHRAMVEDGAIIIDPATTWLDADVRLGQDTVVHPGCQLRGATTIGTNCEIGPDTTLKDTAVANGASVVRTTADLAVIGAHATIGPYSYLRPGTEVGVSGKVGGFVETKNAIIGDDAKVPHLTYCGDARIGSGANIGAGTIFANFDGVKKSLTHIGAQSFIGSNSVLVAPLNIADGTYVAAGSAITDDVAAGELGIGRARQRNISGWVAARRPGTDTASAAATASTKQDSNSINPDKQDA